MKSFYIVFSDGGSCIRYAEDKNALIAELAEEFPGRKILSIEEMN